MKGKLPIDWRNFEKAMLNLTYVGLRVRNRWDERLPEVRDWRTRIKGV